MRDAIYSRRKMLNVLFRRALALRFRPFTLHIVVAKFEPASISI